MVAPSAPAPPLEDPALRAALRAGGLLGWASLAAVGVALLSGVPIRASSFVAGATAVAAVAHLTMVRLPWKTLLTTPRGRLLIDMWGAGVLVAVTGLVVTAGGRSGLDLLLLLVVPFLATAHDDGGRSLGLWLLASAVAFVLAVGLAPDRLPLGEALLHLVILAGATLLGLLLARAVRFQAVARAEQARVAELEGAMLAEAHHRVKNSLQVVSELLLLGRPRDAAGAAALDRAAERITAIAAVHQVLARRGGGRVSAPELLTAVVDSAQGGRAELDVEPVELAFAQAQHLGVVVNELVTNAQQHGVPPVRVRLRSGPPVELLVGDAGGGPPEAAFAGPGLGLPLVTQVVRNGLRGTLAVEPDGAVRITFDPRDDARPAR